MEEKKSAPTLDETSKCLLLLCSCCSTVTVSSYYLPTFPSLHCFFLHRVVYCRAPCSAMEDEDNWGLQAVVRSCGAAAAASPSCSTSSSSSSAVVAGGWTGPLFRLPPSIKEEDEKEVAVSGDYRHLTRGLRSSSASDFHQYPLGDELFRPLFPKPAAHHELTRWAPPPQPPVAKEPQERTKSPSPPPPAPFCSSPVLGAAGAGNQLPGKQQPRPRGMCQQAATNGRSKRRKNLVKKVVCQVPADALCSDVWAWRKYGQKPIKGSLFPRGYYRCSSAKGCPARKQVERSRSDPGMFVITYTSDHNHPVPTHRCCLAGSTRHKSPPPPHTSAILPDPPSSSSSDVAVINPTTSSGAGKPSVSCSPLSSVEEELLLPADVAMGVRGPAVLGGENGMVLDSSDHDDGTLLVVSRGMELGDTLGFVEEYGGGCASGPLFPTTAGTAAGFRTPPSMPTGPEEDGVPGWRDEHLLPFAAVSR